MGDSEFENLVSRLSALDVATVKGAIRSLGALGNQRAVRPLIEVLERATEPTIWNAAAVALRDLQAPAAVSAIVARLRDPATKGARGTLVWALGAFDCVAHVELLVNLAIDDTWETAREAAEAISSLATAIDENVRARCAGAIQAALPDAAPERLDLLRKLLSVLERR